MCFLKNLEFQAAASFQPPHKVEAVQTESEMSSNSGNLSWNNGASLSLAMLSNYMIPISQLGFNLMSLLGSINNNNNMLFGFAKKLDQNDHLLSIADQQIQETLSEHSPTLMSLQTPQELLDNSEKLFSSEETIVRHIFGLKQYKYKLKLNFDFPKIIYKERNLNLAVQLVNADGRPVINANLIHLCLGVCDQSGNWLIEQNGDFFIQGKIQIDLYHGEAEFRKIYPRDVSRHFMNGIVNVIVYAKPSLINFSGESFKNQRVINYEDIEPLAIMDVIVKAKKKNKH